MTTNECKRIRREIDESNSNQEPSSRVADHLRGCSGCQTFAFEQRALGSLIASLQPVEAPSDFDFRLRARLAREREQRQGVSRVGSIFRIPVPVAALLLIILASAMALVVKDRLRPVAIDNASAPAMTVNPSVRGALVEPDSSRLLPVTATLNSRDGIDHSTSPTPLINRRGRNGLAVSHRIEGKATRDFALSSAAVFESQEADSVAVMRVPLDAQVLRVSIDDGSGETRTISLPRVSFGSQRLVASQLSLPVSATQGVW